MRIQYIFISVLLLLSVHIIFLFGLDYKSSNGQSEVVFLTSGQKNSLLTDIIAVTAHDTYVVYKNEVRL